MSATTLPPLTVDADPKNDKGPVFNMDEDLANADWLKRPSDLAASLPEGTDIDAYMKENGLATLPIASKTNRALDKANPAPTVGAKRFGDEGSTQGRVEKGEFGPGMRLVKFRVYNANNPPPKVGTKGYCSRPQWRQMCGTRNAILRSAVRTVTKADQAKVRGANKAQMLRLDRAGRGKNTDRDRRVRFLLNTPGIGTGDGKHGVCAWCGRIGRPELTGGKAGKDRLTVDKIYTGAQGGRYKYGDGTTRPGNCVLACDNCNFGRNATPIFSTPSPSA